MISMDDLILDYDEYSSIKIGATGSVAVGEIKAFGLDISFEIEGTLIGIKAKNGDASIHHVYKSENKENFIKIINDFLDNIRNKESLE